MSQLNDTEFIWDHLKSAIYSALGLYVPFYPLKMLINQNGSLHLLGMKLNTCAPLKDLLSAQLYRLIIKLATWKVSFSV